MDYMGIKELYDLTLKTTSNMEINGNWYEEGEPIITFSKIQVATLGEQKRRTAAKGGFGNQTLVLWEDTRGMEIALSEGVISQTGLSIVSNSKMLRLSNPIQIPYNETLKSEVEDGNRVLTLKHPMVKAPFVYRNGEKITNFQFKNENSHGKILIPDVNDIDEPDYAVYYDYIYEDGAKRVSIGQRAVKGFLLMTGRMRVKDDQSGKETTILVEFPKVQLMSDLTMRLGSAVEPYVYGFNLLAHPVGERGQQYVCNMIMLDKDIDSDI